MEAQPIFITGRFKSGSTLLWHLFRNMGQCTCFFEPCHEMLIERAELNNDVEPVHEGVESYWDEYLPLFPGLKSVHRPELGLDRLFLEEDNEHPLLEKYISFLLSGAEKPPVLQFNRVDFRLPWLKKKFPQAMIIHIFRDPREQWTGMARNLVPEAWEDPFENTQKDLLVWSALLAPEFPFLASKFISSAYHRHYLLWRLSRLMGQRCAHINIGFEELTEYREEELKRFFQNVGIEGIDAAALRGLIKPPGKERWKGLVREDWFEQKEKECEECLAALGLSEWFGLRPLSWIREEYKREWNRYAADVNLVYPLLKYFNGVRTDALKLQLSTDPYIRHLLGEQEELRTEVKSLRDRLNRMEAAKAELVAEMSGAELKRGRLAIELKEMTGQRDTNKILLEKSETDRIRLEERLGQAEVELADIKQDLSRFPWRLFAKNILKEG